MSKWILHSQPFVVLLEPTRVVSVWEKWNWKMASNADGFRVAAQAHLKMKYLVDRAFSLLKLFHIHTLLVLQGRHSRAVLKQTTTPLSWAEN